MYFKGHVYNFLNYDVFLSVKVVKILRFFLNDDVFLSLVVV